MKIKQKTLDDVQMATAVGYDYVDENSIEVTAVAPNYQPDKKVINEVYSAVGELSKEVRNKVNEQSEKPFVSGKIQLALYSRKLAEKGIIEVIDTLQRDPSVGASVLLAVVDGSCKELLNIQYGNSDNGIYLSNLIEQNEDMGIIPMSNLHTFLYSYYSEGKDPFLPMMALKDGRASLAGLAFFNKDKMVDTFNGQDVFIFKSLLENSETDGSIEVKLQSKDKYASLANIQSSRSISIPSPMTTKQITISVKIKSVLRETSGKNLTPKKVKNIEKMAEKEFEKRAEKLIKRFQSENIDPLGIGEETRTSTRHWNYDQWKTIYPEIPIKVKADIRILETGVID
ncbi:Ger(x)C family spore germination protein [Falsibacillus pallidus]|uniref:Spore germination protein n=1 Tax=Falsibacillus pallidus TaxID=493781 RepID=A0A370G2A8_9BACI|nr:Ger(x)C family spore germination protein [Falsibacillus pallidus]RDI38001.1 spore germination protein [Falsibacillus pallidus]